MASLMMRQTGLAVKPQHGVVARGVVGASHVRRGRSLVCYLTNGATDSAPAPTSKGKVVFKLPRRVNYGEHLCLTGALDSLGEWVPEQCVPMSWNEGDLWTAECELPVGVEVEYKYIIVQPNGERVEWSPGNNLVVALPDATVNVEVQDDWEGFEHQIIVDGHLIDAAAATAKSAEQQEAATAEVEATPVAEFANKGDVIDQAAQGAADLAVPEADVAQPDLEARKEGYAATAGGDPLAQAETAAVPEPEPEVSAVSGSAAAADDTPFVATTAEALNGAKSAAKGRLVKLGGDSGADSTGDEDEAVSKNGKRAAVKGKRKTRSV